MKNFRSRIWAGTFGLPERIAEDIFVEVTVSINEGKVRLESSRFVDGTYGEPVNAYLRSMMVDMDQLQARITESFEQDTADTMWEFVEGLGELDNADEEYARLCEALGGDVCADYRSFERLFA